MPETSPSTPPTAAAPPAFVEHQLVRLAGDFEGPEALIPARTVGTVVQVFGRGVAYQVDLDGPFEAPETVPAGLLVPA